MVGPTAGGPSPRHDEGWSRPAEQARRSAPRAPKELFDQAGPKGVREPAPAVDREPAEAVEGPEGWPRCTSTCSYTKRRA